MIKIGSIITWLDGEQTVITSQAEIGMIQQVMSEIKTIDGKPAGGATPRPSGKCKLDNHTAI